MNASSCATIVESRRGMGAMIVLVIVIMLIMAMLGMTSHMQASGTSRTYRRVLDMRTAIEIGESAIGEAVTYVRQSMDTGQPGQAGENWRQLLMSSLESGSPPPEKKVVPVLTRARHTGLTISDVRIRMVDQYLPRPTAGQTLNDLELPQGVLEFAVDVSGAQKIMSVKRQVRQRRAFYITVDPTTAAPNGDLDTANATFTLTTNPLGTVIESR
jgi:hypothetical protein